MRFIAGLRQWAFPREFRIPPSPYAHELEDILNLVRAAIATPPQERPTAADGDRLKLLADVGTGLWRLKQKMVKPGTDQPLDEMKRAFRHLESVWDALSQAGTEIQDHTDNAFDPGMSIKVIAYQPSPGLTREKIIETIKPTIYYNGRLIQMGEVIVGRPETGPKPAGPENA